MCNKVMRFTTLALLVALVAPVSMVALPPVSMVPPTLTTGER